MWAQASQPTSTGRRSRPRGRRPPRRGCHARRRAPSGSPGSTLGRRRRASAPSAPIRSRVLAHERLGRLAERLPVRVGHERVEPGERSDADPSGDALRAAGQRQQAHGRACAPRGDVVHEVGDEVDQAVLAEGEHLVVELLRQLAPKRSRQCSQWQPQCSPAGRSARDAPSAARPEDAVGAGLDRRVGPLAAERAHARVVRAARVRRPVSSTCPTSGWWR